MEKDKSTISEELDQIRNSINKKNEAESDGDNFILLDKIVSKSKKYHKKNNSENNFNNKIVQEKMEEMREMFRNRRGGDRRGRF